jgi:hypothetical protein
MTDLKSRLSPENSMVAGIAVIGLVIANYNLHNGSIAAVQATDAWHPALGTSNKKSGYSSLVLVAGISLLAKDPNIFILGMAAIVAMHSSMIHAIAVEPAQNQMVAPNTGTAYEPAQLAAAAA